MYNKTPSKLEKWRAKYGALIIALSCLVSAITSWSHNWILTVPWEITITEEEAFEKISEKVELKPYYVYDFKQQQSVLCGKLDCQYGINAKWWSSKIK